MITKEEIDKKAIELQVSSASVEKDYVNGWLLNVLYSNSPLKDILVLKGGNGLRKAYFPNTRFSKDLDFSSLEHINIQSLHDELNTICDQVKQKSGVIFELDRTFIRPKNLPILQNDTLEARLYFKGFYGEESISLKTHLDVTQLDKLLLPVQVRPLIHDYSDTILCDALIRCQKAEEILASKLNSLLYRQKVSDLYDLLYSILFSKGIELNRLEVIKTFLQKTIYESTPLTAKELLQKIQLEVFLPYWGTLITPVTSLFHFDTVTSNFNGMVDSLFNLLPQSQTASLSVSQSSSQYSVNSYGSSYSTLSYFSSDMRNIIMNSGRQEKLVELTYEGYTRLVEPYSIEYYVRKDGLGQEYFWAYDITGGRSRAQSIKRFICEKIENCHETDQSFIPRYDIEF